MHIPSNEEGDNPTRSAALSKTGRHFSFLVGDREALCGETELWVTRGMEHHSTRFMTVPHGAMPVFQYEYSSIDGAILEYLRGDTGVLSLRQVSQYCGACPRYYLTGIRDESHTMSMPRDHATGLGALTYSAGLLNLQCTCYLVGQVLEVGTALGICAGIPYA